LEDLANLFIGKGQNGVPESRISLVGLRVAIEDIIASSNEVNVDQLLGIRKSTREGAKKDEAQKFHCLGWN
jgi:hypothetical protein